MIIPNIWKNEGHVPKHQPGYSKYIPNHHQPDNVCEHASMATAGMANHAVQSIAISAMRCNDQDHKKYLKPLPSGNQTWHAGKSPINVGVIRKITDKRYLFHCHV